MKKGFTLIELLIVIIIVGTLVGIALPKYSRAAERGRALEGINNVRYTAEYVGTTHAVSGKTVTTADVQDIVKNKFFTAPTVSGFTVTVQRRAGSGWSYSLTAISNGEGEITSITCTNGTSEDHCTELGLVSGDLL